MLNNKKLEKILKIVGPEMINSIDASTIGAVKEKIVTLELQIKAAQEELEESSSYQRLKEDMKAISAGMKEVKAKYSAIVQYCLHVLEQKQ